VKLVWHTALFLVLENKETIFFKDIPELFCSAHYAVVRLIDKEGVSTCDIFLNEYESSLCAVFVAREAIYFRFLQENFKVIVSEVAKDPLHPDTVVLTREVKFLQTLQKEITCFRYICSCFIELCRRWFYKVNILKQRFEHFFSNATYPCPAIECIIKSRQVACELLDHSNACITLYFMNRFVAT